MNIAANPGLTVGVLGLGTIQVIGLYINTAPKLSDLRSQDPGNIVGRQDLLDADLLIGTSTALLAILASWVTHSPAPLLILLSGLGLVMYWYHSVLNAPSHQGKN